MIEVWPQANKLAEKIISKFGTYDVVQMDEKYQHHTTDFLWKNYLWTDSAFRRANIDIVDSTKL